MAWIQAAAAGVPEQGLCLAGGAVALPPPAALTLSLGELWAEPARRRYGGELDWTLELPMDRTVRPVRLELAWMLAPAVARAELWVESGGETLAQLVAGERREGLWRIPLPESAPPGQGVMRLRLRGRLLPGRDAGCVEDARLWLELSGASRILFTHRRAAASAPVFPAHLARLWVAPGPLVAADGCARRVREDVRWDAERVQAFLELAAALARQYRRPFALRVLVPGERLDAPPGPFERMVVLDVGPGRLLPASDDGCGWGDVVRLPVIGLEQALRPWFGPGWRNPPPLDELRYEEDGRAWLSWAQLGLADRSVRGLGERSLRFDLAQADLGGPVRDLELFFSGRYGPGSGALLVRVNGRLLVERRLEAGRFALWVPVPNQLLRRDNLIQLVFRPDAVCPTNGPPFEAVVEARSGVRFRPGPLRESGFAAFPQAFRGQVPVVIRDVSPARLEQAAILIAALQRVTRARLRPRLVARAGTGPHLLLASAPLMDRGEGFGPFAVRDARGDVLWRQEPDRPVAVLDARAGRIALSGPAPLAGKLLTRALAWDGWYGLFGDLWLYDGRGEPLGFAVEARRLRLEAQSPSPPPWWIRYRNPALGLAALGLVFLLGRLYARLVRPAPPEA